ncbi:MAG: outer membrane lipoprotein carrier protein LolA [Treponema sp.]|jgi:hypothetical protein|nr:outer membrane lipoprotein carrier protein LolA [Treponema sp.]
MKRILLCLLTALSAASLQLSAENASLESVCNGLMEHPVTTGEFTQLKKSAAINRQLRSSGNFLISTEGVIWDTKKPFSSSMVVTRTALIQTAPDGSKTVLDGSKNQTFANVAGTLSSLFSGDKKSLENNFSVDFLSNASSWKMQLVPKDKTIAMTLSAVMLNGRCTSEGGTILDSMTITEQNGDCVSYTFRNQEYKDVLSDAEKSYFAQK